MADLMDTTHDGIHEYDNPMPMWWAGLFWGTIVYSLLYAGYYMIGVGPSTVQDYEEEVGLFYQEQAAKLGDLKPDPQTIATLMSDPKLMLAAAGLFNANCAVCHAKDGGGATGPNLCDDAYLNIRRVEDIFTVISGGVVPKGMPAWDKRFSEPQRVLLTAYVAHLRGTTPAAGKLPQGERVAPWDLPDVGGKEAGGGAAP